MEYLWVGQNKGWEWTGQGEAVGRGLGSRERLPLVLCSGMRLLDSEISKCEPGLPACYKGIFVSLGRRNYLTFCECYF